MNELDQWFFERTGNYPLISEKNTMKKFFLCGYILKLQVVQLMNSQEGPCRVELTATSVNGNVYRIPLLQ